MSFNDQVSTVNDIIPTLHKGEQQIININEPLHRYWSWNLQSPYIITLVLDVQNKHELLYSIQEPVSSLNNSHNLIQVARMKRKYILRLSRYVEARNRWKKHPYCEEFTMSNEVGSVSCGV